MTTVSDLIAQRTAFFNSYISASSPQLSADQERENIEMYEGLTAAWQSAPCKGVADILAKVHFILGNRPVFEALMSCEEDLERFLRSLLAARDADTIDVRDAISRADDLLEAIGMIADGMGNRAEKNAFGTIACKAQQDLAEARRLLGDD